MSAVQTPGARVTVQRLRTQEGCEVLSLYEVDERGQWWQHVTMRTPPLALEIKNTERVYGPRKG